MRRGRDHEFWQEYARRAIRDIARSVAGVPIRLTGERWSHIVEAHDDLAGREEDVLAAIENPDWIGRGYKGSLVAWKGYGRDRYLTVIYKEVAMDDGFVITAFFTRKVNKRNKLWP